MYTYYILGAPFLGFPVESLYNKSLPPLSPDMRRRIHILQAPITGSKLGRHHTCKVLLQKPRNCHSEPETMLRVLLGPKCLRRIYVHVGRLPVPYPFFRIPNFMHLPNGLNRLARYFQEVVRATRNLWSCHVEECSRSMRNCASERDRGPSAPWAVREMAILAMQTCCGPYHQR